MQVIASVASMQRLSTRWRRQGLRIGFVPTMGFLHEGHLSLMRRVRQRVGRRGKVVVSIFVNPTQFGPGEDFERYPRDMKRDLAMCRGEGVDVAFAPNAEEMYPGRARGQFSTYVVEESVSQGMEGSARRGHFRGVTTVVAKLFHMVQPDLAIFGAKDWQQAAVIRRMVENLNFPIKVLVGKTYREPDGLAMSSRNAYLKGDLRRKALVLSRCLRSASEWVQRSGKPLSSALLKARVQRLISNERGARLDYVEFFDSETLRPLAKVTRGSHMALAAYVGRTRLIDNARL
jgi:pantoate--beta-alanine ligase